MKKGYFITYLGAAFTLFLSIFIAEKKAKKYGQPIKAKKKISVESIIPIAEKAFDFEMKKKNEKKAEG